MNNTRIFIGVCILALSIPIGSVFGDDIFDHYPDAGKAIGVEKLTPQERSNLVRLLGRIEAKAMKNCRGDSEASCSRAYTACMAGCPPPNFDDPVLHRRFACPQACETARANCRLARIRSFSLPLGAGEVDVDVDGGFADVGGKGRERVEAEDGVQAGLVDVRIA